MIAISDIALLGSNEKEELEKQFHIYVRFSILAVFFFAMLAYDSYKSLSE